MYAEYVALTQRVATLIEAKRADPSETKDDILWRLLRQGGAVEPVQTPSLDFGQGVNLPVGEKLYLYLTKPDSIDQKPDGVADVKSDGLYLDEVKIEPSHGSSIAPAMKEIQKRRKHFNDKGKIVSLSAYRQWHVIRNGKLIPIDKLKNPALARKRTSKSDKIDVEALLVELGIK